MKRTLLALALAAVAAPLFAQTDGDKLIARVNGKEITNRDLDRLWEKVPPELQERYLKSGGKRGFLENYVAKKLIIDEAISSGYAAKNALKVGADGEGEGILFDHYVRDVIAAPLVNEAELRKIYEARASDFVVPEQAKLRIIRALKKDSPDAAREKIAAAMVEIFSERQKIGQSVAPADASNLLGDKFSEVAARVSDHPSAKDGGRMPWTALHTIPNKVAEAARAMKNGTISGMIETEDAFQLIFKEDYHGEGKESFEAAESAIREFVMAQNAPKIMQALAKKSAELRKTSKVEIFAENIR